MVEREKRWRGRRERIEKGREDRDRDREKGDKRELS